MRKGFLLIGLLVVICSLLGAPSHASAELLAGVQVGYGSTNYGKILDQSGLRATEWLSNLSVDWRHDDLLFTGSYQGALALKDTDISRHQAQVGVSYRFLQDGPLQIYGGLGYQLLTSSFKLDNYAGGEKFSLTGHGFAGQAVVDIEIAPELRANATLALVPWGNWSHSQAKHTVGSDYSGSIFTGKLNLLYDFSEEFGLQLSITGGSFQTPEFDNDKGKTSATFSAINLGVTRQF